MFSIYPPTTARGTCAAQRLQAELPVSDVQSLFSSQPKGKCKMEGLPALLPSEEEEVECYTEATHDKEVHPGNLG